MTELEENLQLILNQHIKLILEFSEQRGAGAHIFRLLKHTKVIDGKETNCEYYFSEYKSNSWNELIKNVQGSNKSVYEKYMQSPERYIFLIITVADESNLFNKWYFKLYETSN